MGAVRVYIHIFLSYCDGIGIGVGLFGYLLSIYYNGDKIAICVLFG